jgi:AcrR family transcriptional regulator
VDSPGKAEGTLAAVAKRAGRPRTSSIPASLDVALIDQVVDRSTDDRARAADEINRLVRATFDVAASTGSLEPHVQHILDAAGLSRATLYSRFKSKDELLLVVLDEGWRMVANHLRKRTAHVEGADAQLREWVRGLFRYAQDPESIRRTRPFVIMGHRLHARFPSEYARGRSLMASTLADIVRAGVREGVFLSDDPDLDALIIYDAVMTAQSNSIVIGAVPTPEEVDLRYRFALRALTAPIPAPDSPVRSQGRRSVR